MSHLRIGIGSDTHRLDKDNSLFIGGILIPSEKGAVGHSDADALIHAICDAILGALGLRDIGFHFPDNNPEYKNIDSKILLGKVVHLMLERNFRIVNLDTIIHLQQPRLSDYIPHMQKCLADILQIQETDISIKAKTGEKVGIIGRQEAIVAQAVVLLEKIIR